MSAALPFDAAVWSWLDGPAAVAGPPAERLNQANAAQRLVEICLDHVLLREVVLEEDARAADGAGLAPDAQAAEGLGDEALVLQAEQDVPGAFNVLVERYFSLVVGAAYSQLGDIDAARDVAQDAFLEAARKLETLRERDKFGNWVYGIARRKAIYVLRRRKLHQAAIKEVQEQVQQPVDDPAAPMARAERNQQIRQALTQLPEIYREILVLKYIDERSYEDIAKVLGISLAAVDKRLMRGKEMLRESLRRWMNE